jgi:hypothetical protein
VDHTAGEAGHLARSVQLGPSGSIPQTKGQAQLSLQQRTSPAHSGPIHR